MIRPTFELKGPRRSGINLFLLNCEEGMQQILDPKSVDVLVTSPPYNIGIRYKTHDDNLPRDVYLDWIERVARLADRVLCDDGSFFLNIGSRPADPWIGLDVAQRLRSIFVLQNLVLWVKSIAIKKTNVGGHRHIISDVAVGHYKPIGGKRFLHDCHEFIFHFTKTGNVQIDRLAIGVPYQDKSNIGRWKAAKTDLRCRGNTWFVPYETIRDREKQRPHPSSFPTQLPEMCIRLHGLQKVRLVLDPFVGLGSTAIAAYRLGVSCVGFDVDKTYLKEAARRLEVEREASRQMELTDAVRRHGSRTHRKAKELGEASDVATRNVGRTISER